MAVRVVSTPSAPRASKASSFAGPAARAVSVAGLIYLIGSLVDLGILWFAQRQAGLQWEFVAITSTIEAWPRMTLAIGLLYVGQFLRGTPPNWIKASLGAFLLLLGVAAAMLGVLLALNYLQVSNNVDPEGLSVLRTSVIKTEILSALYVVTLVPIAILALLDLRSRP